MVLNIRDRNRKIYVSEGQCRLIREYYGLPNNIDSFANYVMDEIRRRWSDSWEYETFNIPYDGLPLGYLEVRPTSMNLRACYGMPPVSSGKPCVLFINPEILFSNKKDATFHATLVHELTHMIEDVGRRGSSEGGLGDELSRVGYSKTFDNVIGKDMLSDKNKSNYTSIEKAVNRVLFYGVGFERNARNAAMFTKLRDLPAGSIRTYNDAIKFLRSTVEYSRYERAVASAWYLVNLSDVVDQMCALYVVRECSDYRFRNWNHFRKWLKQFINRYENKMRTIIPKMINHVINPPVE